MMGLDPNSLPTAFRRAILREPVFKHAPNTRPPVSNTEHSELPKALASDREGEAQSPGLPLVRFTLRRVSLLDVDAKWASVKDLLDGLRYAGIIHGDREGEIDLEVRQEKVSKKAQEQTVIEIFTIQPAGEATGDGKGAA